MEGCKGVSIVPKCLRRMVSWKMGFLDRKDEESKD